MNIEERLKDMDQDAALTQLVDWVANMEERAVDLRTPLGANAWHEWSPAVLGQFDIALEARLPRQAMRDAIKIRLCLYVCEHPEMVELLQGALTQSKRELTKWLGA